MAFLNEPITLVNAVALVMIALVLSMTGGALAGMRIGAKDLGASLAALMGAMFGPAGALPGVIIGLLVLAFMR